MTEYLEPSNQRLQDTDPTVVMDISVGKGLKQGEIVDFDYEAFHETNQRLGGAEDNSDLTFHLGPLDVIDGGNHYSNTDSTIHLNSKQLARKQRTRKNLQHELQHHIDFSKNPPTRGEILRRNIGEKVISNPALLGLSGVLSLPGLLIGSNVPLEHAPLHEVINKLTVIPSLGAAAIWAAGSLYYLNGPERRARQAQRKKLKPIITVAQR